MWFWLLMTACAVSFVWSGVALANCRDLPALERDPRFQALSVVFFVLWCAVAFYPWVGLANGENAVLLPPP